MDRAIALIHVYARKQTQIGRFTYYKKNNLQKLYMDWRRKRVRNYKKYQNIRGSFPDLTNKIYNEVLYDKKKDKAIMEVGEKPQASKKELEAKENESRILGDKDLTNSKKAFLLNCSERTISNRKNALLTPTPP